jgi:hypothetical protein
MSAGEWKNLYLLSRQQTVTGIVFQGIQHLPEHFLPAEELLVRWMAETDAIERKNIQMNKALELLVQWFTESGVQPVLQKGQGIASLYENPLLRECGDIDFYFDSRQMFEKAFSLIRQCGLRKFQGRKPARMTAGAPVLKAEDYLVTLPQVGQAHRFVHRHAVCVDPLVHSQFAGLVVQSTESHCVSFLPPRASGCFNGITFE